MSQYVYGTSLRYTDYLQTKSFADGLESRISADSLRLVGSIEDLGQRVTASGNDLVFSINTSLRELGSSITSGLDELNATFRWGFSGILVELNEVNKSLKEIAKPTQNWAYEQFGIARDAFRQGLFPEALEYTLRCINGDGTHTGYVLEYRFHVFLGTIYLGSFDNSDPEVVDLGKAEAAFISAARYAQRDYPREAARALVAAGWAAYCQGSIDRALSLTRKGIGLNRNLGEASFQIAKILLHVGRVPEATKHFRQAMLIDREYAFRAADDDDFKQHWADVETVLADLRGDAVVAAQGKISEVSARIEDLVRLEVGGQLVANHLDLDLNPIRKELRKAGRLLDRETLFSSQGAKSIAVAADRELDVYIRSVISAAKEDYDERLKNTKGSVRYGVYASFIVTLLYSAWVATEAGHGLVVACNSLLILAITLPIFWNLSLAITRSMKEDSLRLKKRRLLRFEDAIYKTMRRT